MRFPTPRCQPVRVDWIDSAHVPSGWEDAGALRQEFGGQQEGGCVLCVSVGQLFRVGEQDITLVLSSQPSKSGPGPYRVNLAQSIPRAAIRRIRELR